MDEQSDAILLEQWRDGDVAAGQALFERHFEAVHRFFCNKVWGGDVDDLIQETFLGCVRGRGRVSTTFRMYLFGVARKQLLKHCERWSRRHGDERYETTRADALDASPSQLLLDQEEQRLLVRALRRLPLDLQVALELFYWEDMTSAEIAEILDLPHGTARSRLRRARERLRELVEGLAASDPLARSTTGNLEGWLRSVRGKVPVGARP